MRVHDDESWRRSPLITHHLDHPPQVKALVDELYETPAAPRRGGYETMITGEYAEPGEQATYSPCGGGVLATIAMSVGRPLLRRQARRGAAARPGPRVIA